MRVCTDKVLKCKICLLGDPAVGKTSLIGRYVHNTFGEEYLSTVGTNISKKVINVQDFEVQLVIWDLQGQKNRESFQMMTFHYAKGGLLVYDLEKPETIESVSEYWKPRFHGCRPYAPMVLLGNKSDLISISDSEISELEKTTYQIGAESCFLTSAKTGENVEKAFYSLAEHIYERNVSSLNVSLDHI